MRDAAGGTATLGAPAHGVIVPFLDRLPMVGRCVRGLLACARPDTRIVLVDDGSAPAAETDPGVRAVLADPRVTLLRHPTNRGVAAARNTALAWCRAEGLAVVLMLDSDCVPSADFIEAHRRLLAVQPQAACFGAAVEGVGNGFWARLDRVMTWVHMIRPPGEVRHPYHLGTTNFSLKLDRLPARAAVFDERLNTGEDALLIRELRRRGESVRFARTPLIVHHDRETFRGLLWHHYQYGQHQYFVQLGGDMSPRCFHPAYRLAFVLAFLPLLPLYALAGSVLNLAPWLLRHPGYLAWYPLMYLLWTAKGVAVLESAVAPWRTLRLPPDAARRGAPPPDTPRRPPPSPEAPPPPRRWQELLTVAALLVAAAAYCIPALPIGLELTENGMILYPSWRVGHGAVPYRDFVQLFGPSLFYVNAAVLALFGVDLLAVRWLVLALKLAILGLAYLCARRVAALPWALGCVAAVAVVWGTPWWLFNTPYANHFGLTFCLAGIWLALALPTSLVARSAAAGLAFGIAATFKQTTGLFALIALLAALLLAPGAGEQGPRWLMGRLGTALRWLALAAAALLLAAYLAPRQTPWTLLALVGPVAALGVIVARREWSGSLAAPARAAGAAAVLAATAAAALPLLAYAGLFAAHGALGAFVRNTAVGLPDQVYWFVPYAVPPWPSWVAAIAATAGLAALRAWRRRGAWRLPAAVAAAAALVLASHIAVAPAGTWLPTVFGVGILLLPLIAWGGVVELARRPPTPAVAVVASFAIMSLTFLTPAGDPWHALMIAPAFVPLLAHQGQRWMDVPAPARSSLPLGGAAAALGVVLVGPFARMWAQDVAAAHAAATRWRGVMAPTPRFAAATAVVDHLRQRPGAPLLVTASESLLYPLAGRDSSLPAEEFVIYLIGFDIITAADAHQLLPEARVLAQLESLHPTIVEAEPATARFRRFYPAAAQWIDAHYRPSFTPAPYRVLEWAG
jgi:GT2 family glycosyltransferase